MARVAIIGAATGIGAECVTLLKARGDEVIAFDSAEVDWADRWIELDLAEPDAAASVAARVGGAFDALICNPGLPPSERNAAVLLKVNVMGLLAVTRALMPKLIDGGSITMTASRAGQDWKLHLEEIRALLAIKQAGSIDAFVVSRGIDAVRAYHLSNEALIYWAKLQVEGLIARNQRVNTVSPAPVATDGLEDFLSAFGPRAQAMLARTGRAGRPEEIAALITFLASKDSSWINGQDIVVDGGMAAMLEIDAAKA